MKEMLNVLAKVHKPLEVIIKIFLMKKLHNFWYFDEESMESFLGKIFDLKD